MWDWFINFLANVLASIAGFCGDWGLAVIILTVIIRILIMPLLTKSTESSAKMQALQPKLQEIQERYSDNPERQSEELRKFYSENKFNPVGGCLPLLLQMPVFFGLFTVARNVPADASFFSIMPSLSQSAAGAMAQGGITEAFIYIVFDVAFGVFTFIPMIMNANNGNPGQKQQMLIMGIVTSIMMLWFGWSVPGAVLLYYITSALWQIVQTKLVTQRVMARVKAQTEEELKNAPIQVDVVRKERKPRQHKKN